MLMIVVAVCAFAACKKDSSNSNASSIVGKWYVAKIVNWQTNTLTNIITKDTSYYSDGSYSDVRTDGKVYEYTFSNNYRDTCIYSVSGNTLTVTSNYNTTNNTILAIDAHNLQTYFLQTSGSIKYETWDYFSK